ncbi:hypothetical protein GCM10022214_53890 [Actinomadura miaoliensis]|uniref:Uncharacterized protein n=1 Tax=Actinomadura miaoliensis TaxID=430685 RepID=A0ABP7WDU0_9ACTN
MSAAASGPAAVSVAGPARAAPRRPAVRACRGAGAGLGRGGRTLDEGATPPLMITRRRAVSTGKSTMSGPKGLAVILGGMLGMIALLWLLAALVAP